MMEANASVSRPLDNYNYNNVLLILDNCIEQFSILHMFHHNVDITVCLKCLQ